MSTLSEMEKTAKALAAQVEKFVPSHAMFAVLLYDPAPDAGVAVASNALPSAMIPVLRQLLERMEAEACQSLN